MNTSTPMRCIIVFVMKEVNVDCQFEAGMTAQTD